MPRGDGTGPFGKGPFTGRGMGRSNSGRGMGRGMGGGRGMGRGYGMGQGGSPGNWPFHDNEYQSQTAQPLNQSVVALVDEEKCFGCGICVNGCPQGAITMEGRVAKIISDKCTGCGICVGRCPRSAISLAEANE